MVEKEGSELSSSASSDDVNKLVPKLETLIKNLQETLEDLKYSETNSYLQAALHDHDRLPDKEVLLLAGKAVDLLYESQMLLEPGPLVLADQFLGFMTSKCLVAAVELNVPDALRNGPLDFDTLAEKCCARPDRLRQILRPLYNSGIFSFNRGSGLVSNNSTSELLLSDHWTQWRKYVELYANEFYDMARAIPQQVRRDETRMASQIEFGTDKSLFDYVVEKGMVPKFHNAMVAGTTAQSPGILADYPWHEIWNSTVLDVGGGPGGLVASLLREHPMMQAGIYDTPPIIQRARDNFHGEKGTYSDLGNRVPLHRLTAGDFLDSVPEYEVYTFKWCLHNWNNEKSAQILRNIRKAIVCGPRSRLIILESLLSDGQSSRLSRYADLTMMISTNGQERTLEDWTALAEESGWKINRIFHLRNAWPSAIEMVPIWENDGVINEPKPDYAVKLQSNAFLPDFMKKNGHLASTNGTHRAKYECIETSTTHSNDIKNANDRCDKTLVQVNGNRQNAVDAAEVCSRVTTEMSFLEHWDLSKGEPFYRSAPEGDLPSLNFKWETRSDVTVTDARPIKHQFNIQTNAFEYIDDPTGVSDELLAQLRKNDKKLTAEVYYPQIERLLKAHTGASRVIIFDNTVRKRDPGLEKGSNPDGREQPATIVHCDQSARGARQRLEQNLDSGESVETLLKTGRVQLINVWRPLIGPVVDWPLATMDFVSLRPADTHPVSLYRGKYTDRGQTMAFEYHDDQRWYYLDRHRVDEVTLIKIWDSWGDPGETRGGSSKIAACCPHAAFKHPGTPSDADPRESIEVRCLVIYDGLE